MRVDFIHADPINRKHTHIVSFLSAAAKSKQKLNMHKMNGIKSETIFPFDRIGLVCIVWIGLDWIEFDSGRAIFICY